MKYRITKLDARHSYHDSFRFMIEFSRNNWASSGVLDFDRCRRWFNERYGWGQDVETRQEMIQDFIHKAKYNQNTDHHVDIINSAWAYSARYREYRIYVASDRELNFFLLSHPNEA